MIADIDANEPREAAGVLRREDQESGSTSSSLRAALDAGEMIDVFG